MTPIRQQAEKIPLWSVPPLLALVLYWPGLTAWFQNDDFAWLGLRNLVTDWHSFLWAMFAPLAQGTIRPLSERAFFMAFSGVFGLNPYPFHAVAFLTYAAAQVLLASVCTRLTGSRTAGFWAAIFWTVNRAVAITLSWSAVYHQMALSFVLLLAFWFLFKYIETGERRFYVAQLIVFIAGFGVSELNVVYPAIAGAYALFCAPRVLKKLLPLFAISTVYALVHFAVAPVPAAGVYQMHWDLSIVRTFATYVGWGLGSSRQRMVRLGSLSFPIAFAIPIAIALLCFFIWKLRRKEWVAIVFPVWFLAILAPLLPLRDHMQQEYLAASVIGLAMLGGWALVAGWRSTMMGKIVAVLMLAIYLRSSVPAARFAAESFHDRSERIKSVVLGVSRLNAGSPRQMILLSGVNTEILYGVVFHHAFGLYGMDEVYLVPENAQTLPQDPRTESFVIDPALAAKALSENRAVVYDVSGAANPGIGIRDITATYRTSGKSGPLLSRLDLGSDVGTDQLGATWYAREQGFRWMPRQATVKLRGPEQADAELYVAGFSPAAALKSGPLEMTVRVDGESLPPSTLRKEGDFLLTLPIPARFAGRPEIEITLELNRTFSVPSDARQLGVAITSIEIR